MSLIRFSFALVLILTLASCSGARPGAVKLDPENLVEVGTVTPHGVSGTREALVRAGIPAYADGSNYPLPYRILVRPEDRERAIAVLKEIEKDPMSLGYGITHQ